jgi:hypothetical protein
MPAPAVSAPAPPTPLDTGNTLLGENPAILFTALVQTPLGQRLAVTIRTPSTTLTVFLAGQDAKTWAANLATAAAPMSGAGLVAANGNVPRMPGAGK